MKYEPNCNALVVIPSAKLAAKVEEVNSVKTEFQKMIAGELYNASDPSLVNARLRAKKLCFALNHNSFENMTENTIENIANPKGDNIADSTSPPPQMTANAKRHRAILTELMGQGGESVWLEPPFRCDYGSNIHLGKNVYFNFDCVVLDVCHVTIGDFVFIGPGVHIYTASHPLIASERRTVEFGKPVHIGSDVWIGGRAIICPGVNIGDGCVIGAGSVVTRSLPPNQFAAGNPCRIIRSIENQADRSQAMEDMIE